MNKNTLRPKVFMSRCLGFDACRWNGMKIHDRFVEKLKGHVNIVHACPEMEVGLGVPRIPVRIVLKDNAEHMIQLETGRDITKDMVHFSKRLLDSLNDIDGFILKDRSPSCGIKDIKVYPAIDKNNVIRRSSGLFAQAVLNRFPGLAIETEGRLNNYIIREQFLTKLFSLARYRLIAQRKIMKDLIQFHAEHKMVLMAYSQKQMRILGSIVANHEHKKPEQVFADYAGHFKKAFEKPAPYTANINVLMHALGYFSKQLSSAERGLFLNTLEEYRREQIPLSVPLRLLRTHVLRFNEQYLMQQAFFEPYPLDLVEITDSGKGRGAKNY
ncbi:MAG: YbgA family protein [bacterium]